MAATMNAPIILDLGKASRKKVRQLRNGRGKLLGDVQDAMSEVTSAMGEEADGKQLVPVVLIYRRKTRRKSRRGGMLPFLP